MNFSDLVYYQSEVIIDMKRLLIPCGLLLTLFLAVACGGSVEPAAVVAPSEPPAAAVAEEPAIETVSESVDSEAAMAEPAVVVQEIEVEEAVVQEMAVDEMVVEETAVEETAAEIEPAMAEEAIVEEAQPAAVVEVIGYNDFEKISQTGRPQFLNSYADWWSTWRANAPIVDGLKETYASQLDFFDLNIDDASLNQLRQANNITNRSQYVLLAPDGTILRQWFGPLDSSSMEAQIAAVLRDNGY